MLLNREDVRTFEVKVRLSLGEWEKVRAMAEKRGETMAAVVRALALEAARESAMPEHGTDFLAFFGAPNLPEELKRDLQALAMQDDRPVSEYIRVVLVQHVYGAKAKLPTPSERQQAETLVQSQERHEPQQFCRSNDKARPGLCPAKPSVSGP